MPTIGVSAEALFAELNDEKTTYNEQNFAELCFDFGIELDDFEDGELKIEIPANRYDMLCYEGIATQLKVFLRKQAVPKYRLSDIPESKFQTLTVSEEVAKVRPYVASAILRNVTFDETRYNSFIELQDKLHQNLARQRTLVSIGTHDLDTIQGPFTYEALPPKDIAFIPLNQTKKMNAAELMEFYEKDKHLGRYLHIIRDAPVYPVIFDANRTVCSLPPIINGEHSKITTKTKNVFIEITATDKTKLDVVCNIMTTMFSEYCAEPFVIEPVKIVSPHDNMSRITPSLANREFEVEVAYINGCIGLDLSAQEIAKLLERMSYTTAPAGKDKIKVIAPCTRADVLHACDIMEDVGIAYGFNELPRTSGLTSVTQGKPLPINSLADIVREESNKRFVEVLNLVLCSLDENFAWMNRKDDGKTGVKIANPKSLEFQVCRTALVPGLLKSLRENRHQPLPIQIFEAGDVVLKDESLERKARNERHWAAAYYGKAANLETIHGLMDRIMEMLKVEFIGSTEAIAAGKDNGYFLEAIDDDGAFFPGRAAAIYVQRPDQERIRVGEMGILHPSVLAKFNLKHVVSVVELNLEVFL